jgi:hypothetical protein
MGLTQSEITKSKLGNRFLTGNSRKAYNKHFDGFNHFLAMKGDHSSMLMLLEKPPTNFCPSVWVKMLEMYLRWKRGKSLKEILKDGGERTPLQDNDGIDQLDVFGDPIYIAGGWNTKGNCDQLMSALQVVHSARGQRGPYSDPCVDCLRLKAAAREANPVGNVRSEPCQFHDAPVIWRKGNPVNSDEIVNAKKFNSRGIYSCHRHHLIN